MKRQVTDVTFQKQVKEGEEETDTQTDNDNNHEL